MFQSDLGTVGDLLKGHWGLSDVVQLHDPFVVGVDVWVQSDLLLLGPSLLKWMAKKDKYNTSGTPKRTDPLAKVCLRSFGTGTVKSPMRNHMSHTFKAPIQAMVNRPTHLDETANPKAIPVESKARYQWKDKGVSFWNLLKP
ncbi:hypothetical protein WICPIJ_008563 [Wickerhamomyces pijperi]|uniref:Uncharacterized protein n=1 Tax=Wickerhamomyces pijperi TaxID=599730 RepID=A0A9P8TIL9_WICPI|nr:hypothetical protein WICPIJ_008563 [Wickerhamomyces pijperi]